MVEVPPELEHIAKRVEAGELPVTTVRTLLSWFRAQRRGVNTVGAVNRALRARGLVTVPSFENAWIDAQIQIQPASRDQDTEAPREGQTVGEGVRSPLPAVAPEQAPSPHDDAGKAPPLPPPEPAAPALLVQPMPPRRDPVHRVGKLPAANRDVVTVRLGTTVQQVTTLMILHDYSQVPVMKNDYTVKGVVSWRSIGRRTVLHNTAPALVDECLEEPSVCSSEASLFDAARQVVERGYVLVRGPKNLLQGILTATDLSEQFGLLLEPFMFIGEIEGHLRALIDQRLPLEVIARGKDPDDTHRVVESAANLTFGEYKRLLEREENWCQLGLSLDRGYFVQALEQLRQIRNDLMHFEPEGLEVSETQAIREFVRLLRDLPRQ